MEFMKNQSIKKSRPKLIINIIFINSYFAQVRFKLKQNQLHQVINSNKLEKIPTPDSDKMKGNLKFEQKLDKIAKFIQLFYDRKQKFTNH